MFEQNNVGVRLISPVNSYINTLKPDSLSSNILMTIAENISATLDEEDWEECSSSDCDSNCEEKEDEVEEEEEEEEEEEIIEESGDPNLDKLREILRNDGEDNIFPPLDGTAFYSTICKINHSCEPNVIVRYSIEGNGGRGLIAQLTALRMIHPDEELLQSYIDQSMGKNIIIYF
jgi:hypothetical protein